MCVCDDALEEADALEEVLIAGGLDGFTPEEVEAMVGADTGIGPESIVLLLRLPPGVWEPTSSLLLFIGEARVTLISPPTGEGDDKEGSLVLLLCLDPVSIPELETSAPELVLVLVRSAIEFGVVAGVLESKVILCLGGREVTLNDGIGARCLIGIGAILSSLSFDVSLSFCRSGSRSDSCSTSKSDTGECGASDKDKDCALILPFPTGDFFLNFVGERFDVCFSFSFPFSFPLNFTVPSIPSLVSPELNPKSLSLSLSLSPVLEIKLILPPSISTNP